MTVTVKQLALIRGTQERHGGPVSSFDYLRTQIRTHEDVQNWLQLIRSGKNPETEQGSEEVRTSQQQILSEIKVAEHHSYTERHLR